jgi:hypothetical protein
MEGEGDCGRSFAGAQIRPSCTQRSVGCFGHEAKAYKAYEE